MIPRPLSAATLLCLFVAILFSQVLSGQVVPGKENAPFEKTAGNTNLVAHEDLDALLWIQNSAEYSAITRQTFRLAQLNLEASMADTTWTASIEQQEMFADKPAELEALPVAIIVDVDETVLDNSIYQTRLIRTASEFDPDSWTRFVKEEISSSVPGAPRVNRGMPNCECRGSFCNQPRVQSGRFNSPKPDHGLDCLIRTTGI